MKIYVAVSACFIMLTSASSHAYYSDGYQEYGVDDLSLAIGKIYEYGEDAYIQDLYQQVTSKLGKYGALEGCSYLYVYNPDTGTTETKPQDPPEDFHSFLRFVAYCERTLHEQGVWYWNSIAQQRFDVTTEQFFQDKYFVQGVGCLTQDILSYSYFRGPSYRFEMMRYCS
ncbi:hypothetical protein [Aeromonas salmonicida]